MSSLYVFDASVLIDYTRGVPASRLFCDPLVLSRCAAVHPVAAAEVIVGSRNRLELEQHTAVLAAFRPIAVRNSDFDRALTLIMETHLSHAIGWPDCLIAAAALRLRLPVVTLNAKHFRVFKGLKVIVPY